MKENRMRMLALIVAGVALAGGSGTSAARPSCYTAARLDVPPAQGLTLAVIDTTTPVEPAAIRGFSDAVNALASRPGERVVLVRFAGWAAGERPEVRADIYNEPPLPADQVKVLPMASTERLNRCLGGLVYANRQRLGQALTEALPTGAGESSGVQSEIVYSLRWILSEFAAGGAPTRLLVLSDGWEHSRSGVSFYEKGTPRLLDPAMELARVERAGLAVLPNKARYADLDVGWWGLSAQARSAKRYVDPKEVERLGEFWQGLLRRFGARRVRIGLAPVDVSFEPPLAQ
jgi:hypothetical protein